MGNYRLGLDVGPNSVGWALVDEEGKRILRLGSHVFPEGVDKFGTKKEQSLSAERGLRRRMRRQAQRRGRRKRSLRATLVEAGLFPADPAAQQKLLERDPYALRMQALERRLEPEELGRVFFHLGVRRGFLSNAKRDREKTQTAKEDGEIRELPPEITAQSDGPTLGQYFHSKLAAVNHCDPAAAVRIRGYRTLRAMFRREFEAIWTAQRNFGHAELLTDQLKFGDCGEQKYPLRPRRRNHRRTVLQHFGLHGVLFFQRKMYWPASSVGWCELEPKFSRCPKADRRFQRFRMLQTVNNLQYRDFDSGEERRLDAAQRGLLLSTLERHEELTFAKVVELLRLPDSVAFNLAEGGRRLPGMEVDVRMAEAVGKDWHRRTEEEKNAIVELLIDYDRDDEATLGELADRFGMKRREAEAALNAALPSGHARLSRQAIKKLLPHLEQGLIYQAASDPTQSAVHAAGYRRRDERSRRALDFLPDPQRTRDCPIRDIGNPIVARALVETRKVVNAILREHGKPTAIHIEMARDVRPRPRPGTKALRRYQAAEKERKIRTQRREDAAEALRNLGVAPNRRNTTRYILWQDQGMMCAYTGRTIDVRDLFGRGMVEVDHILPRCRTLDDSQENQVVCFAFENADKSDRTPYEWLAAADPSRYDGLCRRMETWLHAGRISREKYQRFLRKELELDDFIARQLNDTRYLARAAAEYLRCLYEADHAVLGTRGLHTADLRYRWGLDDLLAELPDSPTRRGKAAKPDGGGKLRSDHRHHALDAVLIALTDRRRLQSLAEVFRHGAGGRGSQRLDVPWEGFRNDLRAMLEQVVVSQRARRKVAGALHEDSLYGKTEVAGRWGVRKPVAELTPNEIERIRDPGIRRIVIARLKEKGIEFGRGVEKVAFKAMQAAMAGLKMPSGVPIKKVRLTKSDASVLEIRKENSSSGAAYVKPGAIHHIGIFEIETPKGKKWEAVADFRLRVAQRLVDPAMRGQPHRQIVVRTHPDDPNARFVMSLSAGEMIRVEEEGVSRILVFRSAVSTQGQIYFTENTDACEATKRCIVAESLREKKARKVTVDPLGRVRWAGD